MRLPGQRRFLLGLSLTAALLAVAFAIMLAVLMRLLSPLTRLGLPGDRIALAVALVIRFIPVLTERITLIRCAWSARSPRPPGWRLMVPAALAALDEAEHVAEALRARGGAG